MNLKFILQKAFWNTLRNYNIIAFSRYTNICASIQ